MFGEEIDARTGEELLRFVRALGKHRYVASRLHLVHAFAIAAASEATSAPDLVAAGAWAAGVLSDPTIDHGSRDERLVRTATDAELVAVLSAFWSGGDAARRAKSRLAASLAAVGAPLPAPPPVPFDEGREDDVFPVLVDAGWELVPLAQLDPARHAGAIAAFDDFEVARFEEESALPQLVPLHELPLLGAPELLAAFDDDGGVRAPFVLWATGNETYLDYVLRGVLRAAKLA